MSTWSQSMSVFSRLLRCSWRYWEVFILGMVLTACGGLLDGFLVWLLKPIIDQGLVQRNAVFIHWLPLLILVVGFSRGAFGCGAKYCVQRVGRTVVMDLRNEIFSHLLKLPMAFFDRESVGRLVSLFIYNTDQLAFTATSALMTGVREGATLMGLLFVMFSLSWQLTLVFLMVAPLIVMIFRYASQRLRRLSHAQQTSMADATHFMEESLSHLSTVRAYGYQTQEINRLAEMLRIKRARELKSVVTDSLGGFAIQLLVMLPLAATLLLATSSFFAITAGTFAAFISAVLAIRMPIQRLSGLNGQLQTGLAGAQSVFDLLDQPEESNQGAQVIPHAQGQITLSSVNFSYASDPNQEVLKDFSLQIQPGETVAFVGLSGAGKSTLFKLLQRFYLPTKGVIAIDGVDIQCMDIASLRAHLAVVSQDVALFSGSVRYNIAYGVEDASETDIIEAAKLAHAWSFIESLPEGLDTQVGTKGASLSGGQKQRICIARALIHKRPILLLDEATSALDTESEALVQSGLNAYHTGQTTLIIAHRLSTVVNADRIVVMQDGRVIEEGNHTTLLGMGGVYASLYQRQFASVAS